MSNSLDLDEKPSYLASHPDPSCLHMAYGTIVVLGRLRVNYTMVICIYSTAHPLSPRSNSSERERVRAALKMLEMIDHIL